MYDFERGLLETDTEILKDYECYKKFVRVTEQRTIDAIYRKLDKFIDGLNTSKDNKFVWMRLSMFLGRQSQATVRDFNYVESAIKKAVGDGKSFLELGGVIFQIAICARPKDETWLSTKNEVSETSFDKYTGEKIKWRAYWRDNNFVPPNLYRPASIQDLVSKFNN